MCKTELGSPREETKLLRMRNELRIQLEESTTLFGAKEQDIAKLRVAIPALRLEMRRLDQQFEQQYLDAQENWLSDVE